MTMALD